MIKILLGLDKEELVEILWESDPEIYKIFKTSENRHEARNLLFDHLNEVEKHLFNIYSDKFFKDVNILERNNSKECIRVLKNIIRTENEHITQFSALKSLYKIAKGKIDPEYLSNGFLLEFIFLFKGINCTSHAYKEQDIPLFLKLNGLDAALDRMASLDRYASDMENHMKKYSTGLDEELIHHRVKNKRFIQDFFGVSDDDWRDYKWHLKNVIKDIYTLQKLVTLSYSEINGLEYAKKFGINFQITPYYISLFDRRNTGKYDRAIRAQVLPSKNYCVNYIKSREEGSSLDFMEERSTSPIKGITRRYPQILILKPIDACGQVCIYCQRNWEIKDIEDAKFSKNTMLNAIEWISENRNIKEVLVTGGDPLILSDDIIDWLLSQLSYIEHIDRIRIGTRVLVTLPFRVTDRLVKILGRYNKLGEKELCIVTHFEHPTEMTYDSLDAINEIKKCGISIYNQQVFTYYNSRRFETCLLRKTLKKSGIDPYYIFNTKGKDETIDYRVPIARIEQERKEEARFLPGIIRTDEPVFNVPRLGKSHLRSWQDHEIIMILEDGRRVYRFYPWESRYALIEPYNYTDVSIYDYLKRLKDDGEDIDEYSSIWYYF